MHPIKRREAFLPSLVTFSLAGLVFCSDGWSSPGAILAHQKISGVDGNFSAPLLDSDEIGGAVACLGDLDGPGPSAVAMAVGATGDDDGGQDRGAVYVLFLNTAGTVLSYQKISDTQGGFTEPLADGDELGGTVACLGDLDGVGPSVVAMAVGAIGDDDGGEDRGAVYVLFLDASGTVLSYRKISDTQGGFTDPLDDLDEFGSAVESMGDLDGAGPGAKALAVGAIGDDDGGSGRGAAYILFLNSTGSVLSSRKISDTQGNFSEPLLDGDEFGGAVAAIGDLDGAGPSVAALAVGAINDDDGGINRGAVHVVFLNAAGDVLSSQTISNTKGNFTATLDNVDELGSSVAGLGDLDGPGPSAAALAVGAVGDDDGGLNRGAGYVLFLDASGNVLSHRKISATQGGLGGVILDGDEFGGSAAALGDFDGVGSAAQSLVFGAIGDAGGGFRRGAVFVLFLEGTTLTDVAGSTRGRSLNALSPARPNPFRHGTMITIRASEAGRVVLSFVDVKGRLVRRLVRDFAGPGERDAFWDGRDDSGRRLKPGTYFYRMSVNGRRAAATERAVLLE